MKVGSGGLLFAGWNVEPLQNVRREHKFGDFPLAKFRGPPPVFQHIEAQCCALVDQVTENVLLDELVDSSPLKLLERRGKKAKSTVFESEVHEMPTYLQHFLGWRDCGDGFALLVAEL
eukprot:scaffold388_cov244-Pinguiococcus_pyrenoidosus.AAC.7